MTNHSNIPLTGVPAKELLVGQGGYMQPWGLYIDQEDRWWLGRNMTVFPGPRVVGMVRVERQEAGVHVSEMDENCPFTPPVGSPKADDLPIIGVSD